MNISLAKYKERGTCNSATQVVVPITYQGAKNLMKTVLPAVSASQLSGVSWIADADDVIARKNAICFNIVMN
jgi:hypothetical protein